MLFRSRLAFAVFLLLTTAACCQLVIQKIAGKLLVSCLCNVSTHVLCPPVLCCAHLGSPSHIRALRSRLPTHDNLPLAVPHLRARGFAVLRPPDRRHASCPVSLHCKHSRLVSNSTLLCAPGLAVSHPRSPFTSADARRSPARRPVSASQWVCCLTTAPCQQLLVWKIICKLLVLCLNNICTYGLCLPVFCCMHPGLPSINSMK